MESTILCMFQFYYELWLSDNHHNDCILTFVAVNALTNKVQQLESQLKMAENIASNLMDNSANADLDDAPHYW